MHIPRSLQPPLSFTLPRPMSLMSCLTCLEGTCASFTRNSSTVSTKRHILLRDGDGVSQPENRCYCGHLMDNHGVRTPNPVPLFPQRGGTIDGTCHQFTSSLSSVRDLKDVVVIVAKLYDRRSLHMINDATDANVLILDICEGTTCSSFLQSGTHLILLGHLMLHPQVARPHVQVPPI